VRDQFDNPVSCASQSAMRAYDRAVDAHLHACLGVLEAADQAIAEQPEFALSHALRALVLAGRGEGASARAALDCALAAPHALAREWSHVELVAALVQGRAQDALVLMTRHVREYPTDAVAVSTALGAYGLLAFSGRADHDAVRLEFVDGLAAHYPPDFAWLMAHRGWARIELRRIEEGMALARRALALRPDNGHNAHMLMHGFVEGGQPREALAFIDEWLPSYPDSALMWGHLQWHAALAHIELGQMEQAVQLLLGPITEFLPRGTPFMGLADFVSLAWRLGLLGERGMPWALARQHAQRHFPQGSNVFGELHLAMLAAAHGDRDALQGVQRRLGSIADGGHEGALVAIRWVQGLGCLLGDDAVGAKDHLNACREGAPRLGGSGAQRRVIGQTGDALRIPQAA
jgi:tetratricopeptide (TPR) repeat protein